ncbi:uncharacterized protein J8A68_001165 [[Candida] subhashii]|uniref:Protein CMS1 n=1 Tax=[Candida] subhashii TaxID=561895 RepID=A0A8J5USW5_9ASCO|nr:uncharacterized protein J8A68_001165 [[Candida] subhashii]KAG7665477.1 hypothetical protein J8A68_001165 [[Candida] subhashii]
MSSKVAQPAADDLDDGLEYDLQYSEPEENFEVIENGSDAEEISDNQQPQPSLSSSKRRKKDNSGLQEKKKMKMEMDIEAKKNISLEESTEMISEFINSKIRRKNQNLSALELAELYFNKSEIRSTSEYKETRNLDNLAGFITQKFKNMLPTNKIKKDKKDKKKKPKKEQKEEQPADQDAEERKFIAIVSMSAIRACDIHRATKDISGSSLKLINKNKLHVDLKLVKTTRSRVLCCTPGRLIKVLNSEDSELKPEEIKIIIVDNSYLDTKKQNIWDIQETFEALKKLTKEGSKLYLY